MGVSREAQILYGFPIPNRLPGGNPEKPSGIGWRTITSPTIGLLCSRGNLARIS